MAIAFIVKKVVKFSFKQKNNSYQHWDRACYMTMIKQWYRGHAVMGLVRRKRSSRTGPLLKNVKKWHPKQNITLFLLSITLTVAPHVCTLTLERKYK